MPEIIEGQRYRINGDVYVGRGGRLVLESAQPQSIQTRPADPRLPAQVRQAENEAAASQYDPARALAELEQTRAQTEQIRLQAQVAEAAARRAESEAQQQQNEISQRRAMVEDATETLLSTERQFRQNIQGGAPWWLGGIWPTDENQTFNTAGQQLIDVANGLFRVPGQGSQDQREFQARQMAQLPSSRQPDSTNQQVFDYVRTRLDNARQAVGLPPMDWENQLRGGGGITPPGSERMDRTTPVVATPSGREQRQFSGGRTRLEEDPVLRGVAGRLGTMLARGTPDAEIRQYLQEAGVNPAETNLDRALQWRRSPDFQRWRQANPGRAWPINESFFTREVPQSAVRDTLSSISESPLGAYGAAAANALTGNRLDEIVGATGGNAEQARAGLGMLREENPGSSLAGDISGAGLAYGGGNALFRGFGATAAGRFLPRVVTAPGNPWRARAGDAAYGAYSGSGDDNLLAGTLANVGGGMFGRSLVRGTGRAARGVTDPAIRYLTERGVPVTIGQIAGQGGRIGQAVRGVEQRVAGLPVVGDLVGGQYRRGLEGFNRAAFDEALTPIGGSNGTRLGENALTNARQLRGNAYDSALSGVDINIDPQFTADIAAARATGGAIPNLGEDFNYILNTRVDPMFSPTGGLTGTNFQAAQRGVRSARSEFAGQPLGYDFGQSMTSVDNALTDLMNRQAPGVTPALGRANQANRMISTLGEAMRPAMNQVEEGAPVFTPAQLGRASISNATRYGGRDAATSPARPFFELQRAGQEVLPNRVPDSGTAGRMTLPLIAAAALGGGGEGLDQLGITDNASTLGLLLAGGLAVPYTNTGRSLIQGALTRRSPAWEKFGERLINSPNIARRLGMFGAPILPFYAVEDY